ncbi:transposase [Streptomyces sp. NPDC059455]|uniref:transposase n=1 Tax=Streptomyces sp. NPDC059455 TaxID=3346837 RepID=UPI0036A655EF
MGAVRPTDLRIQLPAGHPVDRDPRRPREDGRQTTCSPHSSAGRVPPQLPAFRCLASARGSPRRRRTARRFLGALSSAGANRHSDAAAPTDPEWQADYRRCRPPVERAVAWLVQHGNRRLRYRGTIVNNTWLHTRAAALNLRRLVNLGLTHTGGSWQLAPATA